MSSSDPQDTRDPNSLLYYAPTRLRDRANALRALQPLPEAGPQLAPTASPEQRPNSNAAAAPGKPFPKRLRAPSEPEPFEPAGVVRQRAPRKNGVAVVASFSAVAAAVAGIGVLYVTYFAGPAGHALFTTAGGEALLATPQERKAEAVTKLIKKMTAPGLAVDDGDGNINEPLPLGVKITGHPQGETVNLSGLSADTKLTTGAAAGAGEWHVSVNDLPVTAVIPPHDFVGQMKIVAELPAGSGEHISRSAVRLTWRQKAAGGAASLHASGANASARGATQETARQLDPKEIAALIKRGEELVSNGDIPAARLLLQRAAEAHDARAAFELAATYDPVATGQVGHHSVAPDLALARAWYQKARDWGSLEAPKQLEALASADH
jgi:hypothetical protein